jgi:hypothetical protein
MQTKTPDGLIILGVCPCNQPGVLIAKIILNLKRIFSFLINANILSCNLILGHRNMFHNKALAKFNVKFLNVSCRLIVNSARSANPDLVITYWVIRAKVLIWIRSWNFINNSANIYHIPKLRDKLCTYILLSGPMHLTLYTLLWWRWSLYNRPNNCQKETEMILLTNFLDPSSGNNV